MGCLCLVQFPHGGYTRHSQPPPKQPRDREDCHRTKAMMMFRASSLFVYSTSPRSPNMPQSSVSAAAPNPTGSSSGTHLVPAPSIRPFRDTAAEAIVLFNLLIENTNTYTGRFFHDTRPLTFIMHRRALLSHIPCTQQACAPLHCVLGLVPMTVPWFTWGVHVTQWFESDPASIWWITTTARQRTVTMEDRTPMPIIVRNFNQYAVRATLAQGRMQECDKSRVLPNENRQTVKVEEDVILVGSGCSLS